MKTNTILYFSFILIAFACKKDRDVECPLGFKGDNCSERVLPKSMKISSAWISADLGTWPHIDVDSTVTDHGPGNDRADTYLILKQGSNTLHTTGYRLDYGETSTVLVRDSVVFTTPLEVILENGDLTLEMWDKDTLGSDDLIGLVKFDLSSEELGFADRLFVSELLEPSGELNISEYSYE
ncbi:MAG: hypothetical protein MRY83_07535 [Flavobacteriales bacterium]|nr:hypothetical protein [Flavobacteriales bacterium]